MAVFFRAPRVPVGAFRPKRARVAGITADALLDGSNITEAADTLSSAATIDIDATAAITEAADALSCDATIDITADAAITEAADSLSSATAVDITADFSATEAEDALSAAAGVDITADFSKTEADDTLSGEIENGISLDAAISEADDSLLRINLCLRSQEAENAAWTTSQVSVTSDTTAAPDETTTADLLTEDSSTNLHYQAQSGTLLANTTYTISRYVKPNGRTWHFLFLNGSGQAIAWFNCSGAGSIGTVSGTYTNKAASIQALANDWYRIQFTATVDGSGGTGWGTGLASADNTISYAGNGASGAYVWGAQVEAAPAAGSYIATTAAAASRGAEVSIDITATLSKTEADDTLAAISSLDITASAILLEDDDEIAPPDNDTGSAIFDNIFRNRPNFISNSPAYRELTQMPS